MKRRILCFGDSNTWGAIPGEGEDKRLSEDVRWTGVLQRELGQEQYVVIEEGYNGRTLVLDDRIENRLNGLYYFQQCIASQSPLDLIVLMLGTNDLKRKFGMGAKSCTVALKQYLEAIQTVTLAGSKPQVLIMAPPVIEESYKNNPLFADMFGMDAHNESLKFREEYQAFAEENNLEFLDAGEFVKAEPQDGVHISSTSHKVLGIALSKKIKRIFQ